MPTWYMNYLKLVFLGVLGFLWIKTRCCDHSSHAHYHPITNIGYDRNLENPLSSRCSLLFHLLNNGRLFYLSSVFTKIKEGGCIPFAISLILAFIMFGWFNGRQRQMEYELTHKIDMDRLKLLLSATRVSKGFSDSASFTPTFKMGSPLFWVTISRT